MFYNFRVIHEVMRTRSREKKSVTCNPPNSKRPRIEGKLIISTKKLYRSGPLFLKLQNGLTEWSNEIFFHFFPSIRYKTEMKLRNGRQNFFSGVKKRSRYYVI
jgi:hypothetical protein